MDITQLKIEERELLARLSENRDKQKELNTIEFVKINESGIKN